MQAQRLKGGRLGCWHVELEKRCSFEVSRVAARCAIKPLRLLEHDPEKWEPVFRKDHAQTKRGDHDPIQPNRIMISPGVAPGGGLFPARSLKARW
jgi:hypothetical protein